MRKAVHRVQHLYERHREYQRRRQEGFQLGFTLIELLVVIVVLAILAAIVIFSITGVKGQSEAAACAADAKTVETAVAAYTAEVTTPANPIAFADLTAPASATDPGAPYLRAAPVATTTSNGYAITLNGTNSGEVDVTTATQGPLNFDTTGAALCSGL
ncbi:MAG TPA: prepilin-type N-terminal cleavage/methylation domain-containing protein [Acidimicrobiales bacterium]